MLAKNEGFFQKVYELTRLIPYGRVTSYGSIARYIGSPGAARMVGWALNKSFTDKNFICAHRVVNRKGLLTGKIHFGGSEIMKDMLESEGVAIKNDKVVDFEKHFWDPNKELKIG
ncbi:MGMT family protein [Bacteroidota bacterium]